MMNHDNAHCADYTKDCPRSCYRGALVRDLREMDYRIPVSWMNFKGTSECVIGKILEDEE